jgi:hypothetical protein
VTAAYSEGLSPRSWGLAGLVAAILTAGWSPGRFPSGRALATEGRRVAALTATTTARRLREVVDTVLLFASGPPAAASGSNFLV